MDQPVVVVLLTLAAVVVVALLVLLALGRGSLSRLGLALSAFRRVLGEPEVATRVAPLLGPAPQAKKHSAEPLRLLALLQREGRLLDFLLEDFSGLPDEQVGVGVRELHPRWQAAIKEHLELEPVLTQQEGSTVEVPAGFDPSAIRLTGNVTGQPPFRGTLQHHGWRVKDYRLPAPPEGQDEFVLMPAEVELL